MILNDTKQLLIGHLRSRNYSCERSCPDLTFQHCATRLERVFQLDFFSLSQSILGIDV